jgi:hypothetical protein
VWPRTRVVLAWAYTVPVAPWIDQLVREHRPLPFVAQFVAATGGVSWAPAIALGVTLPALLLPNGHLRSPRWRLVVVTSVTGAALTVVAAALVPGPLEELGIENPFGLAGPAGHIAEVLMLAGVLLHWLSLSPAGVCVILRFRSSRGVERQQMRWVAAGAAAAVGGLLLTVLLGLGYAAVVLGLGGLLGQDSSLVVAAATLAVAAAFQPVRRRVQTLVDRRFNRRRYAAATVEAFAARLRDQVDLDALHGELSGRGRPDRAAEPGLALAPARSLAAGGGRVPVVGALGYALVRRRPAPDLRSGAHAAGSWR